jgi:UDP-N-acetylglucosamine--N-acetylmuramyl-(pentapeptide) pyrophosphoryl-undecaprenol N-acetylglucosamine transferase
MDAAIAASDFAISRAGASTVAEFSAAGLPAVYVPYPVGNGEQRLNAVSVCEAGGGLLVEDKNFSSEFISDEVIPLISHAATLSKMSAAAKSQGIPDSTLRLRDFVLESVNT